MHPAPDAFVRQSRPGAAGRPTWRGRDDGVTDTAIRFGIALWSQATIWDDYPAAARLMDGLGHDSLWTNDHLLAEVGPPDQPKFEDWTTLAAWASVTERATLGHRVDANTFRNPALVAKMATTVDHASHGRRVVGIGAS